MNVFAGASGLYALHVESEEGHAGVVRAFRDVLHRRSAVEFQPTEPWIHHADDSDLNQYPRVIGFFLIS